MDPFEYIVTKIPSWDSYVLLAVISITIYWLLILRHRTAGFFDPAFFVILGSAFGWSVVWFMYLQGDISDLYALTFTVAELAFVVGYLISAHRGPAAAARQPLNEPLGFPITVFGVSALIHIASTSAMWTVAGIPLFRASRLGAFEGSGGLGILERLSFSCGAISLFTVFYLLFGNARTRRRGIYYIFLIWCFIATGLSGSKSALLSVGQCAFAVAFLFTGITTRRHVFWGARPGFFFIAAAIAFALLVLTIQKVDDSNSAITSLAFRLISYGDIYIFAYPDATIEQLKGDNILIGVFGGFLSTFRLIPVEQIYTNLGFQFTNLVFPDIDLTVGPNPRHPIFGYHYFGSASFIFSFSVGILTARLQRWLFFTEHRYFLGALMAFMIYLSLVGISVDLESALSKLASTIIGLCLVLPPALLLFPHTIIFTRRWRASRSTVIGGQEFNGFMGST